MPAVNGDGTAHRELLIHCVYLPIQGVTKGEPGLIWLGSLPIKITS
jgi:hypothetical protein